MDCVMAAKERYCVDVVWALCVVEGLGVGGGRVWGYLWVFAGVLILCLVVVVHAMGRRSCWSGHY